MKRLLLVLAIVAAGPAGAVDLPAALRAAFASDPTLASAAANRDAAAENVSIARARLLPQLSMQGTFQQQNQVTDRSGTVTDFTGPYKSASVTLRQAVYRPREWAGLDIGKLQAEYGAYKLVSAQSDLWNRTVAAWVDVLSAQAVRDLYTRTVGAVARSAEQERRRFEVGDGTRDAVAEAAAQLALARAQLAEASLDLQGKLDAFNLLTRLGVRRFEGFRLPPVASLGPIPEAEDRFLERILETNPELAIARASELIAERKMAQLAADHQPTLDVIGGLTRAMNDSTSTLGTSYRNAQIGVQLVVPIFAGGGVVASERQASAAYVAAKADREALLQKLKTLYSSDWKAQDGLRERAQAAEELVQATIEQRRASELGIKAGLRTWVDVGQAEILLARRESDLFNVVATLLKTQSRLLSMLPPDDAAWEQWVQRIALQARL